MTGDWPELRQFERISNRHSQIAVVAAAVVDAVAVVAVGQRLS